MEEQIWEGRPGRNKGLAVFCFAIFSPFLCHLKQILRFLLGAGVDRIHQPFRLQFLQHDFQFLRHHTDLHTFSGRLNLPDFIQPVGGSRIPCSVYPLYTVERWYFQYTIQMLQCVRPIQMVHARIQPLNLLLNLLCQKILIHFL